ncbi:MAG: DbpA RNA binding domain-containing protein, partial [Acidobacteriota bacterium]|nr:DbpA RNA binding domain-containing protein [Acidobacteriota bacterium]
IYDRFTLVDVPSEFTNQVLEQMRTSRIRSQKANVRIADSGDASEKSPKTSEKPSKTFESARNSFEKPRGDFENSRNTFAENSGGDKPPRRKKMDEREKSFSRGKTDGDETIGRGKKTNVHPETETGAKTVKPKKLKDGKKKPKWTKEQREHRNKFPKSK